MSEAFKRASELRDDLPEVHNNLGALFVETHDYEAAISSLKKAIALSLKGPWPWAVLPVKRSVRVGVTC